jgi:hypothetical protein
MPTYPYYYAWRNNSKRLTLYQRRCRIVARGSRNSRLIEFENGQRECVSGNAIRRVRDVSKR